MAPKGKGTAPFGSQLPEDKAHVVLALRAEGNSIRQSERLTGVHRDTIMRPERRAAGQHATTLTTSSWLFPPRTCKIQLDEK